MHPNDIPPRPYVLVQVFIQTEGHNLLLFASYVNTRNFLTIMQAEVYGSESEQNGGGPDFAFNRYLLHNLRSSSKLKPFPHKPEH